MSSDSKIRIPLEVFHRHFVVTHMKDKAAGILNELEGQAQQRSEPPASLLTEWMKSHYPQSGFRDDNWYAIEIPLDSCYFAHTDFRDYPVPKDSRFVDFLCGQRRAIESGSFPHSSDICAPWSGPMPEPLAQQRGTEKYYILDGQLRIFRYWYHNVPNVKVFIYDGQCEV